MFWNCIFVFTALFALDFVWAKYTLAIAGDERLKSALCASGIIALSGSAAVSYVDDPWMLIPAALGAFAGTFASMPRRRPKKDPISDVIFRVVCTRRHLCRKDEPCNGLPRDPLFSAEDAESYNSHL